MRHALKLAFAAVLFFVCTSLTPAKERPTSKKDNTNYYWYLDGGTVYDGWYTISEEITRLENIYGVYIDEDPLDGTQIAAGYGIKSYPHYIYASVFLYSH